jgi:hypothetical protein
MPVHSDEIIARDMLSSFCAPAPSISKAHAAEIPAGMKNDGLSVLAQARERPESHVLCR